MAELSRALEVQAETGRLSSIPHRFAASHRTLPAAHPHILRFICVAQHVQQLALMVDALLV